MLDIVKEYLVKNKWGFEETAPGTIGLSLEIPFIDIEMSIILSIYFSEIRDMSELPALRITAVPILDHLKSDKGLKFFLKLLEINHNLSYTKLAIDEDSDIELILDLKDVTIESLDWAMNEMFNSAYVVQGRAEKS